jgi:hypothetical protein
MGGVALGAAIAVIVACGGRQQGDPFAEKLRKENEITALWTQIRDWRREAKIGLEPAPTNLMQVRLRSVPEVRRVCPDAHEVPPRCDDICDLGSAICDNAETICQIADELGKGDEYAQDKCASAKASCREAKQRCCNCSSTPAEGG